MTAALVLTGLGCFLGGLFTGINLAGRQAEERVLNLWGHSGLFLFLHQHEYRRRKEPHD